MSPSNPNCVSSLSWVARRRIHPADLPSLIDIYRTLDQAYPSPQDWPNGEWPSSGDFTPGRLEVVVGAILTQNVNWRNVEKALSRMVEERLVQADRIKGCSQSFLEETIRPAGFYRQKAKRLKGIARFILAYPGDFFSDVRRVELLSISGIGPETADSILLYACDRPHFVVDAYTRRVFTRYGFLNPEASYQEVQHSFESHLPAEVPLYKRFHALIVEHAKTTCRKTPLCKDCVLRKECQAAG